MNDSQKLQIELETLLAAHHEWLLIDAFGQSFALSRNEFEITVERGKTLFGFLSGKGFQTWRVANFRTKGKEIALDLTRSFGRENLKIRLVPRAPAKELGEAVELARLEKANQIARVIKQDDSSINLVRVALNKENGRLAQIVFEEVFKKQTAVLSDVSGSLTPEVLLSSAILWLVKLQNRRKNPVERLWIAAEKASAKKLRKLHALLRADWKAKILLKQISGETAKNNDEKAVKDLPPLEIEDLWRGKVREPKLAAGTNLSETARRIADLAPAEIDVIFSRRGETLRFNGLPFARVRRVFDREKVWFGTEKARQLLTENNFAEFEELVENLRKFRRFDSANKRHAFFRTAPEAWLESAFRRNIRLLDANLVLSPLYHQFRAEREKIDLLALRRDGRLVIIELKTAPDREMIFQAADYWRKIERLRRGGQLKKTKLFGDLEIANAPAICYLVAPTLSFHRDFGFFARTISGEIEIHRFNLAENWRAELKVLERRRG